MLLYCKRHIQMTSYYNMTNVENEQCSKENDNWTKLQIKLHLISLTIFICKRHIKMKSQNEKNKSK